MPEALNTSLTLAAEVVAETMPDFCCFTLKLFSRPWMLTVTLPSRSSPSVLGAAVRLRAASP